MDALSAAEQGRQRVVHITELMIQLMKILRNLKPNNMMKKHELQICLTNIQKEFHYLKILYNICEAGAPKFADLESLIPIEDTMPITGIKGEAYAKACRERDALREELALRIQQLAEMIMHLRNTIFSINCLLAHAEKVNK